jgi:parvulin-like peptidyl-prolyl isomerase
MRLPRALLALALVTAAAAPVAGQTLLDRVVARVNGTVILLSDVRAAVIFGLIEGPADSELAVEETVQRTLLVEEVNRFPPPEPPAEAVDAELERLRARAGRSLQDVERGTGLSADNVRQLARDRLRIQGYIDQRFGVTVPLTDEQVLQYYRAHPEEFTANGQLTPFERAQGLARERAGLEQRQRTINQWLRDLRARADVSVLPR